jgi:hypothetical protein
MMTPPPPEPDPPPPDEPDPPPPELEPPPGLELPPELEPPAEPPAPDVDGEDGVVEELGPGAAGFGWRSAGRLEVLGGVVIAGTLPEDWFSWIGVGVPLALEDELALPIARAAAKSAASSATRRPRRAGVG